MDSYGPQKCQISELATNRLFNRKLGTKSQNMQLKLELKAALATILNCGCTR